MHFLVSKSIHLLLFSSLLLLSQDPISAEDPVFTDCPPETSNYTLGSQFETNLNRLLPLLSPNGSINLNGYYNYTSGKDPNIIYGYSQRMSGATEEDCKECLKNSTTEIIRRCANRMESVIRYYKCILRYSNHPFFSVDDTTIRRELILLQDAENATIYNNKLGIMMRRLASEAGSKLSKFTTGTTDLNDFQKIYGLAQCTRDLSAGDCTACLEGMISRIPVCCENKKGGNIYSVSCNIRYDPYLFFDNSPETSPPPPIAAPPPPSQPAGQTDGALFVATTGLASILETLRVAINEEAKTDWTKKETLHLLEAVLQYGDDWKEVAKHVGSKEEKECVSWFIKLPFGEQFLRPPDIDEVDKDQTDSGTGVENSSVSSPAKRRCLTPLADASNPITGQAAFLSAVVGSEVAEAAAQAVVAALSESPVTAKQEKSARQVVAKQEKSARRCLFNSDKLNSDGQTTEKISKV